MLEIQVFIRIDNDYDRMYIAMYYKSINYVNRRIRSGRFN